MGAGKAAKVTGRRRYYKAATYTLHGPHFNQPGQLYLPGTVHAAPLERVSSYGSGIHFTWHRRVASRWGPVVLEVEVLGDTFKIPEQVAPRFRSDIPSSLAMGRYNKYRTDRLKVTKIVGLATYGPGGYDSSRRAAEFALQTLNHTLQDNGRKPMRLTGTSLETLRSENFQLWELEEVATEAPQFKRWTISIVADVYTGPGRRDLEQAAREAIESWPVIHRVVSIDAVPYAEEARS